MFDITSSKLLLLGIVALLVIGPKDFPALLRTIGKYVGIIRGHAKEFRAQFDEAMRESELTELKKDVENIAQETQASLSAAGQSVEKSLDEARQSVDASLDTQPVLAPDPLAHNADGLPIAPPQTAPDSEAAGEPNGALQGSEAPAITPAITHGETVAEPAPAQSHEPAHAPSHTTEKSGA